jgi:nucleotide sugar dehydrogenase
MEYEHAKISINFYSVIINFFYIFFNMKISIIGLGFVGGSMWKSFEQKGVKNIEVYDKFKDGGIGNLETCLNTDFCFMALPTPFDSKINEYDKSAIYAVCDELKDKKYTGVIVIKSTVEPETTEKMGIKYPTLKFIHNPEFLTARTAFDDFHNQKHIVLGRDVNCHENLATKLEEFYLTYYPDAEVSHCLSCESESMKIFANTFYAVKIQFFTELHELCDNMNCNYNIVKNLMIKNGWINLMHTTIPGPDGKKSYGGLCFPKDTNALCQFMKNKKTHHKVLDAVINERNLMRNDHDNCS